MTYLINLSVILLALFAVVYRIYKQGQGAERLRQMERFLDDIICAKNIRNKLNYDGEFVKRVRKRFTRE